METGSTYIDNSSMIEHYQQWENDGTVNFAFWLDIQLKKMKGNLVLTLSAYRMQKDKVPRVHKWNKISEV